MMSVTLPRARDVLCAKARTIFFSFSNRHLSSPLSTAELVGVHEFLLLVLDGSSWAQAESGPRVELDFGRHVRHFESQFVVQLFLARLWHPLDLALGCLGLV